MRMRMRMVLLLCAAGCARNLTNAQPRRSALQVRVVVLPVDAAQWRGWGARATAGGGKGMGSQVRRRAAGGTSESDQQHVLCRDENWRGWGREARSRFTVARPQERKAGEGRGARRGQVGDRAGGHNGSQPSGDRDGWATACASCSGTASCCRATAACCHRRRRRCCGGCRRRRRRCRW